MFKMIQNFFPLFVTSVILLFTFFSGAWKQWRRFYSSALFYICVQFGISYLTYEHTLWHFKESAITPNHVVTDFFIAFTNFVPMVILYLSWYPFQSRWMKQAAYVMAWIVTFAIIESTFNFLGLITFHNSWNLCWSIVVWAATFIVIRIHHTKPILAWAICLGCTAFLILWFDIPVSKLK
ncbi:CBO0543 family protein [Paenibacillus montanisoli]|uniref:Uncharacterized protein n=1 Tax=Paenibacillus montanisoli TaxID=2081970 RepID=A0A328U2H0_9BACL|nr:hypothetical protein DL346_17055 [Paenibacillus montanisoli]